MNKDQDTDSKKGYMPTFHRSYLLPKYWGVWLGAGILAGLAFIPVKIRDPLLAKIGKWVGRLAKSGRRRAKINLLYCFPKLTEQQREELVDRMFETAPQSFVMLAELCLRGASKTLARTHWHNQEIIERLKQQQSNVIFMVPHGWAVDAPAMLLAAKGQKMAAMFHHQKNPVADYLWNKARYHFGGACIQEKRVLSLLLLLLDKDIGGFIFQTKIMVRSIANLLIFLVHIRQHYLQSVG